MDLLNLTHEDVDAILAHPIVAQHWANPTKTTSFQIPTDSLPPALQQKLGGAQQLPMRISVGDTPAHADTGKGAFNSTFLLYLSDSPGELVLGDKSVPIKKGAAYSFQEGTRHETRGCGNVPRLMIGPMNEREEPVGISGLVADGSSDYITLRNNPDDFSIVQYRVSSGDWVDLSDWPREVSNTNPDSPADYPLRILFDSPLVLYDPTRYFIARTPGIQFGSASLDSSGNRAQVILVDISGYPGLIQNGTEVGNGQNNIWIFNLDVDVSGSTTASPGAGWIGQRYFGKGASLNSIVNCRSSGEVPENGGGILGEDAGINAEIILLGCSSSGDIIGDSAGGIVGRTAAAEGGDIVCDQCFSTGDISCIYGGGIFGEDAGSNGGFARAYRCYSTGDLIDSNTGGIFGSGAGDLDGSAEAEDCYTTGDILDSDSGGIFGPDAGLGGESSVRCVNCYTVGDVAENSGGLFGPNAGGYADLSGGTPTVQDVLTDPHLVVTNCYVAGVVNGGMDVPGYCFANQEFVPESCYSEAANSSSGWNTVNASTVLQDLPGGDSLRGETWTATTINEPFELSVMGYTPYSTDNIVIIEGTPEFVTVYSYSLLQGETTPEALPINIMGRDYEIQNAVPAGVFIASGTGAVSTSTATPAGVYPIQIRSAGSYHMSVMLLDVGARDTIVVGDDADCCSRPLAPGLKGLDYTTRNEILSGRFIRRGHQMSHGDYLKMKRAQAVAAFSS